MKLILMIIGWIQSGETDFAITCRVILALLIPCFAAGFYAGASTVSVLSDCYSGIAAQGDCKTSEVSDVHIALKERTTDRSPPPGRVSDTVTAVRLHRALDQVDSLLSIMSTNQESDHERAK